ncbi:MAG: polysaccharide biosynthesis protein [Phycisphaera sp.]|nr:MAG: polysaccharide biosynthesis protein [Phycisphaera sp.]
MSQLAQNTTPKAKPRGLLPLAGVPCVVVGDATTAALAARLIPEGGPVVAGLVLTGIGEKGHTGLIGVPTLGSLEALEDVRERLGVRVAIVSLPLDDHAGIAKVRAAIQEAGLEERFLPPVVDLLKRQPPVLVGLGGPPESKSGTAGATMATAPVIDLQALIDRPMRETDEAPLRELIQGRRVLVTGAGGSIGSELARLCARFAPSSLILMERAENALFEIDRRLAWAHPGMARRALLHDVADRDGTRRLLHAERPQVVFHTAAHKHVPLMEDHPAQAISNNLLGTASLVDAAIEVGAQRVVLVSTDKAVAPKSVMGATKRLAEAYGIAADRKARDEGKPTRVAIVRFGNVLGSAASVLRIWSAQVAEGQPITITDRRMTRYFMTIGEAALLVAHAGALEPTDNCGVFVLDMGEPVEIATLAERFTRAHGLAPVWNDGGAPGEQVILETGVRPGEKLHEALVHAAEELVETACPGVLRLSGADDGPDGAEAARALADMAGSADRDAVLAELRRWVPTLGVAPAVQGKSQAPATKRSPAPTRDG